MDEVAGGHVKYQRFFSHEVVSGLVRLLENAQQRRTEFVLGSSGTPPELAVAALEAERTLGLSFNCAILKWYRESDNYRSEAYDPHIDPERFRSIPLALVTLSGEAELAYRAPDGTLQSVHCFANDLVLLDSSLEHWVSPPLGEDGERYYLFLGYDSQSAS